MKKAFLLKLIVLVLIACAPVTLTREAVTQSPVLPTHTLTEKPATTKEAITPTTMTTAEVVRGAIARAHLESLTNEIGARLPGTEAETQAAHYIESTFQDLGYDAEVQSFSRIGWVGADATETMVSSANILAVKAGDSKETIVVGAHYDSSDEGLGADDNASGVSILLELAELLRNEPTPYTIHFVAFGAEEVGLLGSETYVERLSEAQLKRTVAMVNLDSVIAGDIAYVYSMEGDKAVVRDWALDWANQNGFDLQTIPNVALNDEEGDGTADYSAFQRAGIPFAYFEATNWMLGDKDGYTQVNRKYGDEGAIIHTEYDSLMYLDKTFPGRVDEHLELFTSILEAILTQFKFSP